MSISKQVSVFVGGAQKSGTRSVSLYFRQHPEVVVHRTKEGHFFDSHDNFHGDIASQSALDTYHDSFDLNSAQQILCDVTPDYIFRPQAVSRIFQYNPKAKWIILLRNPIDRAYSAWNMEVNRKAETLSFEQALLSELDGNTEERQHDRFQYLARSRYYPQLLNLWKYFPKQQCHIFSAEQVWSQPQDSLFQILKALDVTIQESVDYQHIHKGKYESHLPLKALDLLENQLKFELTKLPELLGWQENPWNKQ